MAQLRMFLDEVEFRLGQFAGLVQHARGNHGLPQVMQEPGQPGVAQLAAIEAELAAQREHQPADRDRMHERVIVGCLQPGEADQRAGIALDRCIDLVHQIERALGIDRLAHSCFREHRDHRAAGLLADARGALQFGAHRSAARPAYIDLARLLRVYPPIGIRARDLWLIATGILDIEPLGYVDPDLCDAAVGEAVDVSRLFHRESRAPERMVQPRATQFVYVHADAQLADRYFFQHWAGHTWPAISCPLRRLPRFLEGASPSAGESRWWVCMTICGPWSAP